MGSEMCIRDRVMGIAPEFGDAFSKAIMGDGNQLPKKGKAFISVNDFDKPKLISIAKDLLNVGFNISATKGTAEFLTKENLKVDTIYKVGEGRPNALDGIKNKEITLVINTPLGAQSRFDENSIGIAATQARIPVLTTLSAAQALIKAIKSNNKNQVRSIQEIHNF